VIVLLDSLCEGSVRVLEVETKMWQSGECATMGRDFVLFEVDQSFREEGLHSAKHGVRVDEDPCVDEERFDLM